MADKIVLNEAASGLRYGYFISSLRLVFCEDHLKNALLFRHLRLPARCNRLPASLPICSIKCAVITQRKARKYVFSISKNQLEVTSVRIDSSFYQTIDQFHNFMKTGDRLVLQSAFRLYNTLLRPVAKQLAGKDKLIIIPHGRLYYLPFEALLTEAPKLAGYKQQAYLIKDYSISYHYSANLYQNNLKESRREVRGFAEIAPVVFRERTFSEKFVAMVEEVFREGALQDLPASKTEVLAIADLFEKRSLPNQVFLYEKATEERFKSRAIKTPAS